MIVRNSSFVFCAALFACFLAVLPTAGAQSNIYYEGIWGWDPIDPGNTNWWVKAWFTAKTNSYDVHYQCGQADGTSHSDDFVTWAVTGTDAEKIFLAGDFTLGAGYKFVATGWISPTSHRVYYKSIGPTEYGKTGSMEATGTNAPWGDPPPSAPGGLTALPASESQVDLAWVDNSSNETGFRVERRSDAAADYVVAASLPAGATSYSDTGLLSGTSYRFRVRSYTSGGSAYSDEAAALTLSGPTPLVECYNDLSWLAGQTTANITTLTRSQSGLLKNYRTGNWTGITLTLDSGGETPTGFGFDAIAGTDARLVFGGKVDCGGCMGFGSADLTMTFTGLGGGRAYDLFLFCNRGYKFYDDRFTTAVLLDIDSFTNHSSTGVARATTNKTHDVSRLAGGDNTTAGRVIRYAAIRPGADGDMTLRLSEYEYCNALLLKAFVDPVADADSDNIPDSEEGGATPYVAGADDRAIDSDLDGTSNSDEYLAGTDPSNGASVLEVTDMSTNGTLLELSFPSAPGRTYFVNARDAMSTGSWHCVGAPTNGTGSSMTLPAPAADAQAFFRIIAVH